LLAAAAQVLASLGLGLIAASARVLAGSHVR